MEHIKLNQSRFHIPIDIREYERHFSDVNPRIMQVGESKPLLQKDVASALGVSQPVISKLVRIGMPMTSIADAKAWHEKHERSMEESWKALSGLEIVVQEDVASALNVSRRTISNLVRIGMPMTSIADAKAWHEKRQRCETPRDFYYLEAYQVRRATCDV
jgi:predicted XRE-type DNA-binding protein